MRGRARPVSTTRSQAGSTSAESCGLRHKLSVAALRSAGLIRGSAAFTRPRVPRDLGSRGRTRPVNYNVQSGGHVVTSPSHATDEGRGGKPGLSPQMRACRGDTGIMETTVYASRLPRSQTGRRSVSGTAHPVPSPRALFLEECGATVGRRPEGASRRELGARPGARSGIQMIVWTRQTCEIRDTCYALRMSGSPERRAGRHFLEAPGGTPIVLSGAPPPTGQGMSRRPRQVVS